LVSAAEAIRVLLATRKPTLKAGQLLAIDGPAGAGKTTLAGLLSEQWPMAIVVHMDDVFAGWNGLADAPERLARDLLKPLAHGKAGQYHRYDWAAHRFVEWVSVTPSPLLIIEGVGSGSLPIGPYLTALVWVETTPKTSLSRGVARDGIALLPNWQRWQKEEQRHFLRHQTKERSDLQFVT
jgi:uridine kinase